MPSIFELIPGSGQQKKRVRFSIPYSSFATNSKPDFIALLDLEATIKETHTMTTELTENPIEDGGYVTDHANIKPRELQIEAIITDNPISFQAAIIGNAAGLVGGIIGRAVKNNYVQAIATGALASIVTKIAKLSNPGSRTGDAMDKLIGAWEGATPISVTESLRQYQNMVITNMVFNRDKETANTLKFTVTLKEIRVVTGKKIPTVRDKLAANVKHTAQSVISNGAQQKAVPTTEQGSNWLTRIANKESITRVGVDVLRNGF